MMTAIAEAKIGRWMKKRIMAGMTRARAVQTCRATAAPRCIGEGRDLVLRRPGGRPWRTSGLIDLLVNYRLAEAQRNGGSRAPQHATVGSKANAALTPGRWGVTGK